MPVVDIYCNKTIIPTSNKSGKEQKNKFLKVIKNSYAKDVQNIYSDIYKICNLSFI